MNQTHLRNHPHLRRQGCQTLWNGFTISWAVNEGADPTTQKLTIATK